MSSPDCLATSWRPDAGVASLLKRRAALSPDAVAAIDLSGKALTAGELDIASADLAAQLQGMAPPGVVAVSLPNCLDAMVAAFAVFRTQHALALIHPELPENLRQAAIGQLAPVAIIRQTTTDLTVVDQSHLAREIWRPPVSERMLGIALCVLTSGSTGQPRVIAAAHRQVLSAVAMISERVRYRAQDLVVVVPPLSFDYGLYQLLLTVRAGGTVLLDPMLGTAQGIAAAIASAHASVLPLVPPMLRALASSPLIGRLDTSCVRLITTTGDLLTEADASAARSAFPQAQIVPMYGLSECKRVAVTPPGSTRPAHAIGLPLSGTDVAVADRGQLRLAAGVVGELVVAGPHLTLGYLGDHQATARRFGIDTRSGLRMLRTGDRLRQDEGGWLYWVGRASDMIKTSGFRLDPAELEEAAARSDLVVESGAYGRFDRARGQVPVLVVRWRSDVDLASGPARLRTFLRATVPPWSVPEIEVRSDPLPRTRNGKIDRAALANGRSASAVPDGGDDAEKQASPQSFLGLGHIPSARYFISCHTQAFLSAYELPTRLTTDEFELLTTTPFGVRSVPGDPHRLLVPFMDPDIGLDRCCAVLSQQCEVQWYPPDGAEAAVRQLRCWLATIPVVIGPVDLGHLTYNHAADTLLGCDHYLVVLGRDGGGYVIRDPEGFVQVDVDERTLLRAWAAERVPEGRGGFTLRRLVLDSRRPVPSADEVLRQVAEYGLENLRAADAEQHGGGDAYLALLRLELTPTVRRSLSFLLPAESYRCKLASLFAARLVAAGAGPVWAGLGALFEEQTTVLAGAHQKITEGGSPQGLRKAAQIEGDIARCASQLRSPP